MAAEIIPLGLRLRQRREELGMSQAQAARELDVARTAYRLWELEAARPAPDRWRVIAQWLGMSLTAMLLAAELIDEREAAGAMQAASAAGLSSERWDDRSDDSEGDYFSQERVMINDLAREGGISEEQAIDLRSVLARIQRMTEGDGSSQWHPGQFRKRFTSTELAPSIARAALVATTVGIPAAAVEGAELVTSELVTNSVRHSGSDWIDVAFTLGADVLRIEVSDQSADSIRPRRDGSGGWGLTIVARLATRWGVDRGRVGKTIWVEFDLKPV